MRKAPTGMQVDAMVPAISKFPVIQEARKITGEADLDFLENRKYVGSPLKTEILHTWLPQQSPNKVLGIDFAGVRAINLSVAEELGPLLMKSVADQPGLAFHFPVYVGLQHNVAYTVDRAFREMKWAVLAFFSKEETQEGLVGAPVAVIGQFTVTALGMLSHGQQKIIEYIERQHAEGIETSSANLAKLELMAEVTASARSKRLTELYQQRLLCYVENPSKRAERLFAPVWRLLTDVELG